MNVNNYIRLLEAENRRLEEENRRLEDENQKLNLRPSQPILPAGSPASLDTPPAPIIENVGHSNNPLVADLLSVDPAVRPAATRSVHPSTSPAILPEVIGTTTIHSAVALGPDFTGVPETTGASPELTDRLISTDRRRNTLTYESISHQTNEQIQPTPQPATMPRASASSADVGESSPLSGPPVPFHKVLAPTFPGFSVLSPSQRREITSAVRAFLLTRLTVVPEIDHHPAVPLELQQAFLEWFARFNEGENLRTEMLSATKGVGKGRREVIRWEGSPAKRARIEKKPENATGVKAKDAQPKLVTANAPYKDTTKDVVPWTDLVRKHYPGMVLGPRHSEFVKTYSVSQQLKVTTRASSGRSVVAIPVEGASAFMESFEKRFYQRTGRVGSVGTSDVGSRAAVGTSVDMQACDGVGSSSQRINGGKVKGLEVNGLEVSGLEVNGLAGNGSVYIEEDHGEGVSHIVHPHAGRCDWQSRSLSKEWTPISP